MCKYDNGRTMRAPTMLRKSKYILYRRTRRGTPAFCAEFASCSITVNRKKGGLTVKRSAFHIGLGTILILMLFANYASAAMVTPYADTVFSSARVSLNTKMNASFTAQTKAKQAEIKVTECVLQVKNGTEWNESTTLTAPSKVATNTSRYSAAKDYSSNCSSRNTYRIKAVFDADGYSKTVYSNSVSY